MTNTHTAAVTTIRTGTDGRIYEVDATGRATLAVCRWLVERRIEDYSYAVDCGARLTRLDDDGWDCAHGHSHRTYGSAEWAVRDHAEWLEERYAATYGY